MDRRPRQTRRDRLPWWFEPEKVDVPCCVDTANPRIRRVADIEEAVLSRLDGSRKVQGSVERRASVPAVARVLCPGDGVDDALRIDSANDMVISVGDQKVPLRVHRNALRTVQRRLQGRAAIAAVAVLAGSGDRALMMPRRSILRIR